MVHFRFLLRLLHFQVALSLVMPHPSLYKIVPLGLPHLEVCHSRSPRSHLCLCRLAHSTRHQVAPCTPPHLCLHVQTGSTATTSTSDSELVQFLENGCGCKRAGGRPCYTLFPKQHYQEIRWQYAERTRNEFDVVFMGQIMATTVNDTTTQCTKFRHTPTQRKLSSMAFFPWWPSGLWEDIQDTGYSRMHSGHHKILACCFSERSRVQVHALENG